MVKQLSVATLLLLGSCSNTSSTAPRCLAPAGLSLADRLQAHLGEEEKSGFSGAVQVVRGDTTAFAGEFGRSTDDDHPTAYWIASISKAFAATAVMRLVEQGRLSLEAPLSTWFPEAPQAYAGVTVHHLLSHRSGLPVEYAADGMADAGAAARAILALSPRGPVGQFFYSNDGYSLLAILVERVSGHTYEDHVRTNIFEPAGMTASGFWGFEPAPTPVAPPVRAPSSPAIWANGRGVANYGYRGATGIFSTVEDLARFARAFRTGKLVSLASVETMVSSKNPSLGPDAQSYGYGWAIRFRGGVLSEYWHGGNESPLGHNGQLRVSGNDIIVTLSNGGEADGRSWASRVDEGVKACMQ